MKVELINWDNSAKEKLIFAKETRHNLKAKDFGKLLELDEEVLNERLSYVFDTIGSGWEFVDYYFLISEVTRAFTHQLVRHRVGVSFAQQAQRAVDMSDFDCEIPKTVKRDYASYQIWSKTVSDIKEGYRELIKRGIPIQDARGLLPTNVHTSIFMKMNLRAISDMMSMRLCLRAQGEFQNVALLMREEMIRVHPWVEPILAPYCITNLHCRFPRFECPIKIEHPRIGRDKELQEAVKLVWSKLAGNSDFQPELPK